MTERPLSDIIEHFAVSWLDFHGAGGRPNTSTVFHKLDALRDQNKDIDKFLESASDDDLTSAMLAVHEVYDGIELAKRMVEKEYSR